MAEDTTPEAESPSTIAETSAPEGEKLDQKVEVSDIGPCKKHIKVVVERQAIDKRFHEKYTELVRSDTSQVNGFRPGKVPRKIIERRFKASVEEQVRTEVLMASLEQLATENKISPLSPPDLDPSKLEIPESGPFIYEFDVEVRPEFELPPYKGLALKRLVKTFTQEEIVREQRRILEPAGQLVPKEGADAKVELDDYIVADVSILDGDEELNKLLEIRIKVESQLTLPDGIAENFGKVMKGSKVGDERTVEIKLSESIGNVSLKGKLISAKFAVKDIKFVRMPVMTPEILSEFGVRNEEQFQELIGATLERRLEYIQRQSYRQQILAQITEASQWELPQDLLERQSKRALQKKVIEMCSSGMTEEQIVGRTRKLQQDIYRSTAMALREHFVLQKIAELEEIEIEEKDIDAEIERIADRAEESPRKVRARMEKDDQIDALATELMERQALDLVLQNATYIDIELKSEDEEGEVSNVSQQALPDATAAEQPH